MFHPVITFSSLKEDFKNVDESLDDDLSGICVNLVQDIHDQSRQLTIEVFGQDGLDSAPVMSEVYDPDDESAITPETLINLLDFKIINLLIKKKQFIHFNRGWQTEVIVNPMNWSLTTQKLVAEDQ